MTNESSDPIRPEEESIPDGGQIEESAAESENYVSELRETLESEAAKEIPRRKTGFFERFTKRLKSPPPNPVDAQNQSSIETTPDSFREDIAPAAIDPDDFSAAVSEVPTGEEEAELSALTIHSEEVEFSEPAQLPPADLMDDQENLTLENPVIPPTPAGEESSQWKAFLATLWKQSDSPEGEEALDDETLASRVESSVPNQSRVGKERETPEESSPFVFDQDQQSDEPPEGKKITGSLVFDEGEDIFSEGEGNIWSGLREELEVTQAEIDEGPHPETIEPEEVVPALNETFLDWQEAQADEVVSGSPILEDEVSEEEIRSLESRPFSEEYAHLFGQETQDEAAPEPEPSVQEIRTIVMEDYEESEEEAGGKAKARPVGRQLRTVLLVLISIGLILLVVIVSMPAIMQWIQPPAPAPAAAVPPPTAIPMEGMPYPTGVRMTGGWFFYLQPSTIQDGRWEPVTSEWLNGSELRRIVALPWTRQLEVVVQSLIPGDTIELHMSNGDILTFLVEETTQVDRSDVSIFTSNTPSLALVLYKQEENNRWVVISNMRE
jgi:hypothetical protein